MKLNTGITVLATALTMAMTLALGAPANAKAEDMQYNDHRLTNTMYLTPYTQTNYVTPFGSLGSYSAWPTNGLGCTATNSNQTTYAPTTAVPIKIMDLQNMPDYLLVMGSIANASTATTNGYMQVGLSLSHDGIAWVSNAVSTTLFQMNYTNPAEYFGVIPLINGTNAFTGYQYARWDYLSTSVTNAGGGLVISNVVVGALGAHPL